MTGSNLAAWHPRAEFAAAQQMGEGILLELMRMDLLGVGFAPFSASRFSIGPSCRTDDDVHKSRELWIICSGKGELSYAGQTVSIGAGEAYFFQGGHAHSVRNTGDEPLQVFSAWWPV